MLLMISTGLRAFSQRRSLGYCIAVTDLSQMRVLQTLDASAFQSVTVTNLHYRLC